MRRLSLRARDPLFITYGELFRCVFEIREYLFDDNVFLFAGFAARERCRFGVEWNIPEKSVSSE